MTYCRVKAIKIMNFFKVINSHTLKKKNYYRHFFKNINLSRNKSLVDIQN